MITSSGESIQLECYASGYPQPTISWRRENNDLLPTGGATYKGNILIIHNITKAERGTYYCIADNNVGSGARRNVLVEVEFAPIVHVERTHYEQALRYDADLHCHVECYPAPTIRWFKDGIEIQDSTNYQVTIFSTSHDYTDSVLRVKRIESKHLGEYTCRATNKLGFSQKTIKLIESPYPVCPPACGSSYSGLESNTIPLLPSILITLSATIITVLTMSIT